MTIVRVFIEPVPPLKTELDQLEPPGIVFVSDTELVSPLATVTAVVVPAIPPLFTVNDPPFTTVTPV